MKTTPPKAAPHDELHVLTKSQHQLAALMTAAAVKPKRICEQLGMSRAKYRLFLQSGVFKSLVVNYRQKLIERGLTDANAMLLGDAPANIQFLRDVRDGTIVGDAKDLHIRLRASQTLLDKQLPKNQESFDPDRVSQVMRTIANQACHEVGEALEIEATPLDDALDALGNA